MGKNGSATLGIGEDGPSSTSTGVGSNPSGTPSNDSSSSIVSGKAARSTSAEEALKPNKICQSSSPSSQSVASTQTLPTATNFLSSPSPSKKISTATTSGLLNNLSGLSSSTSSDGRGGSHEQKLGKSGSNNITSTSSSSGVVFGSLFTGLGAKIPVINPSAMAPLEKQLKGVHSAESCRSATHESSGGAHKPGGGAAVISKDGENDENSIANNNNNNTKRNSKNMENISFLSSATGLPPIPPTVAPTSTTLGNITSVNATSIASVTSQPQLKPSVVRVSLPTKSSKQNSRLKSPSRRRSQTVVSPPPATFEDMGMGSSYSSSQSHHHHHHGSSNATTAGKSVKKKLSGKRYASSLPDRERCTSVTSPVAFDLNSYLCHSQGPIDFTNLLNRVHQQQQLLQLSQQQLHNHAPPPQPSHVIHHPQPTLPFLGHPKPTKHCKNKHLWARASIERELCNASPTPSNSGAGGGGLSHTCNNLGSNNDGGSVLGEGEGSNKPLCGVSAKFAVGGAALPPHPSNRHSSYHPNYGLGLASVNDTSASAAALQAAAAAYNAHLLFSRPTSPSPLFLGDSGGSCCSDFSGPSYCAGCAAKTFPRVAARASGTHHGLCFCCHQNSGNASNNGGGGGCGSANQANRASASTPGICANDGAGSLLGLDYEDRLLRLESDKDTLHLQVSVLSDQIEAQTAKIHDLEKMLDDKRNVLESTEEHLQRICAESFEQELLLRSSLETQKLELMTEISSLRLKHASLERENIELKDRVVGKSTGDLSYIDGSIGGGSGGNNRIWDKPPIGPERAASPAHSISVDPSVLAAAARARLGSAGSEHQHFPPQRTRTPPANAYRRIDQSAFGTIPRRSPHSSQLSANSNAAAPYNGSLLAGGQLGTGGPGGIGMGDHSYANKSGKANSLSSGNIHAISNLSSALPQLTPEQKQKTLHQYQQHLLLFHQQQLLLAAAAAAQQNKRTISPLPNTFHWTGDNNLRDEDSDNDNGDGDEGNDDLERVEELDDDGEAGADTSIINDDNFKHNDLVAAIPSTSPSCPQQPNHSSLVGSGTLCNLTSETPSSPDNKTRSSRSGAWAYRKARRILTPGSNAVGGGGGGGIVSSLSRVFNSRSGCRSSSTPNLVTITDSEQWDRKAGLESNNGPSTKSKQSPTNGSNNHKSRGILRILGKLKRSNSGGLDNDVAPSENTFASSTGVTSGGPFVRGGVRATAHPRLGWMKDPSPIIKKPDGPVNSWDSDAMITWLNYLGLGTYSGEVKRWVKSGQQLLDASNHELEKELGIKNILHRKKLSLALHALRHPEEEDHAGKLDYHWVIRWLDDVGLPQYKECFMEGRIDGRVLGHLTAEDLVSLKVTSVLHHASLKRGIQLLRIHKFHPDCLCRRGGPNPGAVGNGGTMSGASASTTGIVGGGSGTSGGTIVLGNSNGGTNGTGGGSGGGGGGGSNAGEHCTTNLPLGSVWGPKQVASWTNHRVMEWLKAIDLAEYAPNLRGSGVHGALIIFEPRFNSELLATLLAIPGNKTLLRRHLSLQFNELVGRYIVQEKRVAETASDFIPLNPTTKVKLPKKSQFPLRKKRLSTEMTEDLLCPQDLNSYPFNTESSVQITTSSSATGGGAVLSNEISVDGTTKTVGEEKVSDI